MRFLALDGLEVGLAVQVLARMDELAMDRRGAEIEALAVLVGNRVGEVVGRMFS